MGITDPEAGRKRRNRTLKQGASGENEGFYLQIKD
jgi:hypothetical protein